MAHAEVRQLAFRRVECPGQTLFTFDSQLGHELSGLDIVVVAFVGQSGLDGAGVAEQLVDRCRIFGVELSLGLGHRTRSIRQRAPRLGQRRGHLLV